LSIKLATNKNERSKQQEMKLKICKFPNCKKEFLGRGKTKYCTEHRKQKYKKFLYQRPISNGIGESNVVVKHKNNKAVKSIRVCGLEGCDCEYDVTLIPNQIIYPKYCPEHRNKYKREFFINKGKETNDV